MGSNENVLIYAKSHAKETWIWKKLFRKSVDL